MINDNQAKHLKVTIDALKAGISKGSSEGFSSSVQLSSMSIVKSLIEVPIHYITDPFQTMFDKGNLREFERGIRDANYINSRRNPDTQKMPEKGAAEKAVRKAFQDIVSSANQITLNYFKPFMQSVDSNWDRPGKTPTALALDLGLDGPNDRNQSLNIDTSELNEFSVSYKTTKKPMDMILGFVLPSMRTKFDALASFADIDYSSIIENAKSEELTSDEIGHISNLENYLGRIWP